MTRANQFAAVRQSLTGVDSRDKITGKTVYAGDIQLPDMLHGKVLRSPHAHATIRSIDVSAAQSLSGVAAIATGADLVGLDAVYGAFIRDQGVLATAKVRYLGDPVAAVAAVDEATAYHALALIQVEYEPLPSLMTMQAALAADAPELFDRKHEAELAPAGAGSAWVQEPSPNILFEYTHSFGDPAELMSRCSHVFEDRFTFARLSHFALEPHVTLAAVTDERIEVWSNNQDPFLLQRDMARIFKRPVETVLFHSGFVGGGFGSKSYCKIEPIAALLARKAKRPVRLALSMDESMMTVCEHAAELILKTGVSSAGETMAREVEVLLDGGAYADASPSVAARVATRFSGPYRWEAVRTKATVVRTTTVPAGSFRGFGAAHVTWASESQIDMIARRLRQDPVDFRLRNFLQPGASPVPGETPLDCDLRAGLSAIAARTDRGVPRRPGRGVGFAATIKSAGAGHRSDAVVRIVGSGRVVVSTGVTDIGQSNRTALTQIVAETLRISPDLIEFSAADTDAMPFDAGTHASTGLTIGGLAVQRAAAKALGLTIDFAARALACKPAELAWDGFCIQRADEKHTLATLLRRAGESPDTEFCGEASMQTAGRSFFWMPSWTAAEVDVDAETGRVSVLSLVTAVEVGIAINPERCRSQAEGAAVQGLGQALFEHLDYIGDSAHAGEPLRYRVPRIRDVPTRFEALVLEQGLGPGPFGSKGVGEAGNLTVPAAIANAVADAVGARVVNLPLTPERVLGAIDDYKATTSALEETLKPDAEH